MKQGDIQLIKVIGIVLLFVIFIFVGVFILQYFNHIFFLPNFTIYKEVCGEGFFNKDFYNDCVFLLMDYEDLMNMTMHNDFSRMCNIWAIRIGEIKSSCERFEVDFMEIRDLCDYKFIKKGVEGVYAGSNNNYSWYECGSIYFKNLNFTWLNDNCDCTQICFDNERGKPSECYLNKKYKGACHKYKCGDYIVEVYK